MLYLKVAIPLNRVIVATKRIFTNHEVGESVAIPLNRVIVATMAETQTQMDLDALVAIPLNRVIVATELGAKYREIDRQIVAIPSNWVIVATASRSSYSTKAESGACRNPLKSSHRCNKLRNGEELKKIISFVAIPLNRVIVATKAGEKKSS